MWISVDNVTDFTGLKPQHLKLDKTDTQRLEEIVADWILQSESLIKEYTHNYKDVEDDDVPDAVGLGMLYHPELVVVQQDPGSPVTVGHGSECAEILFFCVHQLTLPAFLITCSSYVKRIVVPHSSTYFHVVLVYLNCLFLSLTPLTLTPLTPYLSFK